MINNNKNDIIKGKNNGLSIVKPQKKKKIFISCGEMSGDLHASYIVEEMRKKDKNVEFFGVVGDKSIKAGVKAVNHIKNNDVMGFVEALKKYSYFTEKAHEYLEFIKENGIETVIFVDFGGFNLKFFELLKKKILKKELQNLRMVYYIPPKVWAWGKGRIKKLRKFDDVIVIFPFEKEYYDESLRKDKSKGLKVEYFGNPFVDKYDFSDKLGKKILLLPGSRRQEIKAMLPVFEEIINDLKDDKFILKLNSTQDLKYTENFKKYDNVEIIIDKKLKDIVSDCKLSVATSGTITLELALLGLPSIVVYKTTFINYLIGKYILKIGYISLPNLVLNDEIFPELIQKDCEAKNIEKHMKKILENLPEIEEKIENMRKKVEGKAVVESYADFLVKEGK